ncbi:MAG: hypothetical protein IJU50_04070 [Lachnospiraceae bacterium]|nr:hypothetical protein [Lachnospiraceae bacterium]
MKNKKTLTRLAKGAAVISCFALLAGCGKKEEEEAGHTGVGEPIPEAEQIQTASAGAVDLLVDEPENASLNANVIGEGDFSVDRAVSGVTAFLTNDLNVREYPSLASSCKGYLELGSWVVLNGITEDGGWYLVDYNGADGYIRADLVQASLTAGGQTGDGIFTTPEGSFDGIDADKIPDIYWNYVDGQ